MLRALRRVAEGGLTVGLSNSRPSAVVHWGTEMLFLAGLFVLAILAVLKPRRIVLRPSFLGAAR
jgi:hypothetical protein